MKVSPRTVLNLILSLTLAVPSYGFGLGEIPSTTVDIPKLPGLTDTEFFSRGVVQIDRESGGDIPNAVPGDFFLLYNQTVHHKEVPVASTLSAQRWRRARLNALIEKAELAVSNFPADVKASNLQEYTDLEYARNLLEQYQNAYTTKNTPRRGKIDKDLYKYARETEDVTAFVNVTASNLPLGEDDKKALEAAQTAGERLAVITDYLLSEALVDYLWVGRRVDTPYFLWMARSHSGRLQKIVNLLKLKRDRWEVNGQLREANPTESELLTRTRYVNWFNTRIVVHQNGDEVAELKMTDTLRGKAEPGTQPYYCAADSCAFSIAQGKTKLNTFSIPARVIATIGQFVVFSHTNSYDSEHQMNHLLFIDLGANTGLIGNSDIPVYRLPLRGLKEEVRSMVARDGVLYVNDYPVSLKTLADVSKVYDPIVSLVDGLTNPNTWAKVLPVADDIDALNSETIREMLESQGQQARNLEEAAVDFKRISKDVSAVVGAHVRKQILTDKEYGDLKLLHDTIPADPGKGRWDEVEQWQAQVAAVKTYHKNMSQSRMLGNMLAQSQKQQRTSRKLEARVRLFATAMTSPSPHRSQHIKEAIMRWRVGKNLQAEPGNPVNALIKAFDRPVLTGGLIAAGVLAATAPGAFHTLTEMGLATANGVANYAVIAVGGMIESSYVGVERAVQGLTSATHIKAQYWDNGNSYRTAVGLSSFVATLASVWFLPHALINLYQLHKDMKKPDYTNLVDRQNRLSDQYYKALANEDAAKHNVTVRFSESEDREIKEFLAAEKETFERTSVWRRVSDGVRGAASRVAKYMDDTLTKHIIQPAMESQTQYLADLMEIESHSPAIKRVETSTPEEFQGFWKILKNNTMVQSVVGGFKNMWKGKAAPPAALAAAAATENGVSDPATAAAVVATTPPTQVMDPRMVEQPDEDESVCAIDGAGGDDQAKADAEAAAATAAQSGKPSLWQRTDGVRKLFFSAPAVECTLERMAYFWNRWMMVRFSIASWKTVRIANTHIPYMIAPRPISAATLLLYPHFMQTVALRRMGKRVIPTNLNGGMRSPFISRWMSESRARDIFDNELMGELPELAGGADVKDLWDTKRYRELLANFEDRIIDVEAKISEEAFRAALSALSAELVRPDGELRNIEDARKLRDKPIDYVASPELRELTWNSRTFLRAYYDSAYDKAMGEFMEETLAKQTAEASVQEDVVSTTPEEDVAVSEPETLRAATGEDPTQVTGQRTAAHLRDRLLALRTVRKDLSTSFEFDAERAKSIAKTVIANDADHIEEARAAVKRGRLYSGNVASDMKYKMVAAYDPEQEQNLSLKRVETVNRMLQSPGALSRAVRSEITKLFITVPCELAFKLILTAAIVSGSTKPIQDTFWGPNALFYLSAQVFFVEILSRFSMQLLSDAWLKLQQDARQNDLGGFDEIPKGEDAEKSYLRYYFKQVQAPDNSFMANWKYDLSVSFWNMPAAFVNIQLFNYIFSLLWGGRLDLSAMLAGYVMLVTLPTSTVQHRFEQAFERSTGYALRHIKSEKWLAHTDVQRAMLPVKQRLRVRFNLWNDIFSVALNDVVQNIRMVPASLGTRNYQRAIFGGPLLEEILVKRGLEPLQNVVQHIPGVSKFMDPILKSCVGLLTNGNVDLNLPGKNGKPSAGGH